MRHQRGFTLIEVMIVVAIVAILSAIAIPMYTDYVRRARITDAVSQLSTMRVKMEQFFQDNRSYSGACTDAPPVTVANRPVDTQYFAFACPTLNANNYTVTATGINAMLGFTYAIDQSNTRTTTAVPTGWTPGTCGWVLKKDGSC